MIECIIVNFQQCISTAAERLPYTFIIFFSYECIIFHIVGEGKILCGRQDGTCTLYNTRSSHQIVLSGKVKY